MERKEQSTIDALGVAPDRINYPERKCDKLEAAQEVTAGNLDSTVHRVQTCETTTAQHTGEILSIQKIQASLVDQWEAIRRKLSRLALVARLSTTLPLSS